MNRASRYMPTFIAENTQVDAFVRDMHLIAVMNATRYVVAYLAPRVSSRSVFCDENVCVYD